MRLVLRALVAAWTFGALGVGSLGGCGSDKLTEPSGSAMIAKPWAPKSVTGVSLRSDGIYLDNAWVADLPAADAIDKLPRLEAASRAKRMQWREESANLNKPFPGVEQIELPETVSCRAALSITISLIGAGFPNLSFLLGGEEKVEVPVDGTFIMDAFEPSSLAPHAWFQDSGPVVVWDKPCYAAFDEVAPEALSDALAELYPGEKKYLTLVVGCDAGVPFRRVLNSYVTVRERLAKPTLLLLSAAGSCVEGVERFPQHKPLLMPPKLMSAPPRGYAVKPASALGKAKVTIGSIDAPPSVAAAMQKSIAPLNVKLAGCYAQAMEEMMGAFSGKAVIALELGKLGGVLDARVESSDVGVDPGALSCIRDQLSVVQLDIKPLKRTTVRVPLELST